MLMLFAAIAVARQFITLQHPIPITIHPMKHGDQAGIKFMLFDRPVFVVIKLGKAAILAAVSSSRLIAPSSLVSSFWACIIDLFLRSVVISALASR